MRIGYECTTIKPGRSGVGYSAERLARALPGALGPDDEVWALTNGEPPPWLRALAPTRPLWPTALWMQVAVPRIARRTGLDLYHFTNSHAPALFDPPFLVTIHDASLIRFPEMHPMRRRFYQRMQMRRTALRARRVLTNSQTSARDLVELLGVPSERVTVIPLAAADHFRPVEDADHLARIRRRYGIEGRFILYVGNIEPRKNLARLVEAFTRLTHGDVSLVLAGASAWLSESVERRVAGLGSRVRLLGYVPDEDLPALVTAAEVFAYPSLWEGFGLPVVEAMACGTPVVTSNVSSLVEVAGDAAVLVDPRSVEAIAGALAAVLADEGLRRRLSAAGIERASSFSWAETARLTVEAYRAVLDDER